MRGIRELDLAVGRRVRYLHFNGFGQSRRPLATVQDVHQPAALMLGKKRGVEELWQDLFSNTSEWWDHRSDKMNPRFPDFRHKHTRESLWLADLRNPPWVQTELAAIPPSAFQLNALSWNQRLKRYAKSGQYKKTLELFHKMQQERVVPDPWTFLPVLNACGGLGALEEGRRIHRQTVQVGFDSHAYVCNCLVDMYAKCGSMEDAQSVFDKMPTPDVITWTAMIGGYVKSGQGFKAIELFQTMQQEGFWPNSVTFVGVLNACASVAALDQGKFVHEQIIQNGCESDVFVGNALVDMYAKCGSMGDALRVFEKMPVRDVVTWNAMLGGYAMHGNAEEAIRLFKRMVNDGVKTDGITFISLMSACSHGGLVKEGLDYFNSMSSQFDVRPTTEHYSCMIDLLGRGGRLGEAEELAKRMPLETSVSAWRVLLGACRIHGDIEIAERAAKRCLELDPKNASGYVLLSNIYAAAGKWDRSAAIERKRFKSKEAKEVELDLDQGE